VGESSDDPRLNPRSKELAKAIKFVVDLKADSTYAASLQASALALLPKDPPVKAALIRCRDFLMQTTLAKGGHSYSVKGAEAKRVSDNSNSNYALMGLAAIEDADVPGVEIPQSYWKNYDAYWRTNQNADGGWGYAPNDRPTSQATMTAAGMASLLLLRQHVVSETLAAPKPDKALDSAMVSLGKQYNKTTENVYFTFTLERIGLVGGYKYINGVNWYKESAAVLMKKQEANGSWALDSIGTFYVIVPPNVFTAYAIMFLSRGRSPVLFNKLQYDGPWDARPRDDANVSAFIGRSFEKPLAWQSVSLKGEQDWLDAPVLYIAGAKDPKFTPADIATLRAYVEAGGIIFSTADNASAEFTAAMKKAAGQMVDDRHEMRDLDPAHPVFTLWNKVDKPPKLAGMSNGVREVWIHSPADLGAVWQRNNPKANKAPFEIAANLYQYVSGKTSLGHRLDTLAVKPATEPATRTLSVARVKYNGNWDPEPGAWPRMAKLAPAQFRTALKVEAVPAPLLDASKTPIAHLTGTAAVSLDAEYRQGLAKFVADGGTLVVESCGGLKPFTDSAKALLAQVFPDSKLEPLAPDDRLFSDGAPDAVKIPAVEWRKFTRVRDNAAPDDKPRLQGIKKDGRWIVLFSADDFTSGLLGTNTWGVAGYAPKSAQDLVRNILLTFRK
jgi:hypothetical protein